MLGNACIADIIGMKLDLFVGPRIYGKHMNHYFLSYSGGPNKKYGDRWDSIFIPVFDMIKDGRRVMDVPFDYSHPSEQTKIESGDTSFNGKRLEQLASLVKACEEHWNSYKI